MYTFITMFFFVSTFFASHLFRSVSDGGQIDANDIQDLGKVVLEKGQQGGPQLGSEMPL